MSFKEAYLLFPVPNTLVKGRSSHWRCFVRKGVLRNFARFTGKHLCQSLYFNKFAEVCNFMKMKTGTGVFL